MPRRAVAVSQLYSPVYGGRRGVSRARNLFSLSRRGVAVRHVSRRLDMRRYPNPTPRTALTRTLTLTYSHTRTHAHSLSHTLTHTHARTHSHSHSRSHSHSHLHAHPHARSGGSVGGRVRLPGEPRGLPRLYLRQRDLLRRQPHLRHVPRYSLHCTAGSADCPHMYRFRHRYSYRYRYICI